MMPYSPRSNSAMYEELKARRHDRFMTSALFWLSLAALVGFIVCAACGLQLTDLPTNLG